MDPTTGLNLLLAALAGMFAYWSYREQKKATYMQFYEIMARHHSEEITALRRDVLTRLPDAVRGAQAAGKTLFETDPDLQLRVSLLANYYEALGMFLKGGWTIFPKQARNAMLEMLHNSVTKSWPLIESYQAQIYPSRPPDWAGSYRWLHGMVQSYRRTHGIEDAQS